MTAKDTELINRSRSRNWSYCIQATSCAETSSARETLLDMAYSKMRLEK